MPEPPTESPTPAPTLALTEAEFRARLTALGLALDGRAFAAAWAGAQHLRAELVRIDRYLDRPDD